MLYIPNIDDYLEILTDKDVKNFVAMNFSEHFKSINEEPKLRKSPKQLYIFLAKPNEVERYVETDYSDNFVHQYNVKTLNPFDQELQLINTNPLIKNKLKELLNEMKKFKVSAILLLDYKKRNDRKILYSNVNLIASDSDIDETFKSMHRNIKT